MKIRRIVVGLDIAPQSREALAAAARLAAEMDAELEALFVESEELHRLAGFPFARELGFPSAAARPIDAQALERSLRAQAEQARRALTELAAPRDLRWSFRVTRGSVPEQLLAASSGDDITVVGLSRLGPDALQLARETPSTLLVLPQGTTLRGPVAGICPIEVAPARAIPLLCSLSNALGGGLTVLAMGDDLAAAGRWCEEAGALLDERGRKASLEIVRGGQAEALQAALERLAPRAVAIVAPVPRPAR